jgi:hypothetical protein
VAIASFVAPAARRVLPFRLLPRPARSSTTQTD